jgi:hypothetical protein
LPNGASFSLRESGRTATLIGAIAGWSLRKTRLSDQGADADLQGTTPEERMQMMAIGVGRLGT